MGRLTAVNVERAKVPADGQQFIRDDAIKGLALRVTANGSKSFVFEGRIRGRVRRITLGQHPALSVLLARRKALEVKAAIAQGRDPSEERQAEQAELTFRELAQIYIERHAQQHKRSYKQDELILAKHLAHWNGRKLSATTPEHVVKLHQVVGRDSGHYAANRLVALLRTMFNLARDWGYLKTDNPAQRVKFFREEKRERFLSSEELARVNEALLEEPNLYWRAFFPLALLLGPRRSELLSARWTDIDLEQRTWRIPTTKAGRSHLLPLPQHAIEILRSLPSRGKNEFVFPGDGATGHLVEPKKAWQRIRARARVADVRLHDLRRTLGSWLAAQGYSLPLIGKALNHSNVSTTQIYARLNLDPVREALERNAALMLGERPRPTADGEDNP